MPLTIKDASDDGPSSSEQPKRTYTKWTPKDAGKDDAKTFKDASPKVPDLTKDELAAKLSILFNGISGLLRSESEWQPRQFDTIAVALLDGIKLFAPLAMLLRFIMPLIAVFDVVDKVRTILSNRKSKGGNKPAESQGTGTVPGYQWDRKDVTG